jgi:hypothetical protein
MFALFEDVSARILSCFQAKTRLVWAILAFPILMNASYGLAQEAKKTDAKVSDADTDDATNGITFSEPIESFWEFGMNIAASSNSFRIRATLPVPMDWPEQTIEVIGEEKTNAIGKLVLKDNTDCAKQLSFKVQQMAGGQKESVLIRYRIQKRLIVAPKETSQFELATEIPRNLKTFLKPSPYIESNHKRIREIAKQLKDDDLAAWNQVEAIYRWVRENVEYKFDKQIHSCLDALDSKHGDCEELSSLFIAICRAQGIPARAVWIPDHTYPEFYLVDKDGGGHWFPCQAAGTYEFGSMTEAKPILHKGDRFKIDGERNQVRYLRPTLYAKPGAASIGWINRQIEKPADVQTKE